MNPALEEFNFIFSRKSKIGSLILLIWVTELMNQEVRKLIRSSITKHKKSLNMIMIWNMGLSRYSRKNVLHSHFSHGK